MIKISKYKVGNYIAGYWEQIFKSEPSWKAYQLGLAQGMFQTYKTIKTLEDSELVNKLFHEMCKGKEEYHLILKTLIVLENESSEKIDHMMELFQHKKKDDMLTDQELKLVAEITEYLYRNDKQGVV